jgi:hypothetical protein
MKTIKVGKATVEFFAQENLLEDIMYMATTEKVYDGRKRKDLNDLFLWGRLSQEWQNYICDAYYHIGDHHTPKPTKPITALRESIS